MKRFSYYILQDRTAERTFIIDLESGVLINIRLNSELTLLISHSKILLTSVRVDWLFIVIYLPVKFVK